MILLHIIQQFIIFFSQVQAKTRDILVKVYQDSYQLIFLLKKIGHKQGQIERI
jgi:hypothetical protein